MENQILSVRADTVPENRSVSFAEFDRRAKNGERLNVVFFGASLTWGANASDPLLTSYRNHVEHKLQRRYPQAHFTFWNSAIGGTGSQLGVFRVERDVLRHKPDLVFLDFTANDDIYSDNTERHASYEAIVHRLIREGNCPVVQVIFPFKWNIKEGEMAKMKRRNAHYQIAQHYNTAVGDAVLLATERVAQGKITLEALWPLDGAHPGDVGYELFGEAAWQGFQSGLREKKVCRVPEKRLFGDTYMTSNRARLAQLGAPPVGWKVMWPNRVSAYFDMLMSRWQEQQLVAQRGENTARLELRFKGEMVMLFGEGTPKSAHYHVYLDGKRLEHSVQGETFTEYDAGQLASRAQGNTHHVQILATGLNGDVWHTLEIEPLFKTENETELRLESLCVAGGAARVELP